MRSKKMYGVRAVPVEETEVEWIGATRRPRPLEPMDLRRRKGGLAAPAVPPPGRKPRGGSRASASGGRPPRCSMWSRSVSEFSSRANSIRVRR